MRKILSKILIVTIAMSVFLTGCSSESKESADANIENVNATENAENKVTFEGKYIVNADYVMENKNNENVLLIDARGEEVAKEGTVDGAIAVKWQMIANVEGKPGDEMWGTVLSTDELSEKLSSFGIDMDKEIIIFGTAQKGWGDEGRILWELNMAGCENAKMVDGGYDALVKAGLDITKGASAPVPSEVVIAELNNDHNINTDELKAEYDNFKIVDARADEEYDGQTLYGESKGGHLPNAIHINFTDLFNEDGMLKSNADIETMFNENGITKEDKVVTYCTAGIRSAYMQLVLEMCGFESTLNYDESYYRWCVVNDVE
jgi:thiosulfate/3-mercaptopyruvate sulfurtransferase